jgi:parallel beta-helix repeat protein
MRIHFPIVVACGFLLAAQFAVLGAALASADFYVAVNGSDSWSGTLPAPNGGGTDGPFLTLDRARQAVAGVSRTSRSTPIVVMLRGGAYRLSNAVSFAAGDSGTAAVPVVYQAYPNEIPVLSGGQPITGWVENAGVWTVHLPAVQSGSWNFSQLWVNGQRRYRPRFVNAGKPKNQTGYEYVANPILSTDPNGSGCQALADTQTNTSTCLDRFYFNAGDMLSTWSNLADIDVPFFGNWTMARLKIKSVDTAKNIVYFTGTPSKDSADTPRASHRYLVENVKEALSQPGQWYLDRPSGTLTYLPMPGESLDSVSAVAPKIEQLVAAKNLSYVTFQGITFAETNWNTPAAGYKSNHAEPSLTPALSFQTANYVTIDGCTIARTGEHGIWFSSNSRNNVIKNSMIADMGAGGIMFGNVMTAADSDSNVTAFNSVTNTIVASGGRLFAGGLGINLWNVHDTLLQNIDLFDFYNQGISMGNSYQYTDTSNYTYNNKVLYSRIYNLGQGVSSDMGAVHTLGQPSANPGAQTALIEYNIFHDITHDPGTDGYGGNGIYFDQASTNVTAQNNLVYRISQAAFSTTYCKNAALLNNVFANVETDPTSAANGDHGVFYVNAPETYLVISIKNNVIQYTGNTDVLGGQWFAKSQSGTPGCKDANGQSTACTNSFLLADNLYYNTAGAPVTFSKLSLKSWQSMGEDLGSMIADPLFTCPGNTNGCHDDYSLQAGSPALSVGFQPFDSELSQAGYQGPLTAPQVAPAYPLQGVSYSPAPAGSSRPIGRRPAP